MGFFSRFKTTGVSSSLKPYEALIADINALESECGSLSEHELTQRVVDLKQRVADGTPLDKLLPETFALVREAARRTLGERHYDVQLAGGIALHQGSIVEMKTGEGKTLVATLPACLNALTGKGVHVVTVNDYLSRRDAVWMGQVYALLGLSVGVITHAGAYRYQEPPREEHDRERDVRGTFEVFNEYLIPCSKREAYAADVTYGTNNEFGFDYLRDNLLYRPLDLAQRGYHYAIVDEVDSILIDEARTPLIISSVSHEAENLYQNFARIAAQLKRDTDYTVNEKDRVTLLTEAGIEHAEKLLGVRDIYTEKGMKYVHHLETAVRAKELFTRDRHYVVRDGAVVIVDEFTGRMQPGRRWSEGLHQAIEAKEGVRVEHESRTVASITFQNYFRMYEKLSGMTGTAETSAEEFRKVYGRPVAVIPPNVPSRRNDLPDRIYQTEVGKLTAIVREVKALYEKGQPVLVGTASIEKNELISAALTKAQVPHEVLNAKNHEQEGAIIARAGTEKSVVIATNLAGRGVDIKLGGPEATEEMRARVRELGGLFVLGTERHEARRIDNQLRGRSGRQGDPGVTCFFISLEDDLMRIFGSERTRRLIGTLGVPEDEPIESKMISRAIEGAQEKIEGFHFDARKHVLEYDDVLNIQRSAVYGRRRELLTSGGVMVETFLNEVVEHTPSEERAALQEMIREKRAALGEEEFTQALCVGALQTIDALWMEHLETMDYLRSSVSLRAYGQRDPLVEYKREGLALYKQLEQALYVNVALLIPHLAAQGVTPTIAVRPEDMVENTQNTAPATQGGVQKVGRNDPCPCGSGKKYKKCHGK